MSEMLEVAIGDLANTVKTAVDLHGAGMEEYLSDLASCVDRIHAQISESMDPRDTFARAAMAAQLGNPETVRRIVDEFGASKLAESIAKLSYEFADAMMSASCE